jgi:diaminohydroxyphosphoribosylaminopyrimidine deaminase/5-amino-6-(5-phosphoribosylamino)uracil reductase
MADRGKTQGDEDVRWMRRALALARRGIGCTHPNPRVGAVVVKDGIKLGEGWHARPGGPHAEVEALRAAGPSARGATIYVTLEPCAAHGRTPPCTEAIAEAGIRRVVYASADPNPQMAGGGQRLSHRGIEVRAGVLHAQADALNRPFFHFMRHGRPFVLAKAAVSLDGKLATRTYHSQWISGPESRRHAHRLRAESDAILVGAGTLERDNPSLTVRDAHVLGRPPLRVVIAGRMPAYREDCRLLGGDAPTRLYVREKSLEAASWESAGVEVVQAGTLHQILTHLGRDGRLALLLEGGGRLHASFLEMRLTNELVLYQAPLLIGGHDAVNFWSGIGCSRLSQAPRLEDVERRMLGVDQMIRGRVAYPG